MNLEGAGLKRWIAPESHHSARGNQGSAEGHQDSSYWEGWSDGMVALGGRAGVDPSGGRSLG